MYISYESHRSEKPDYIYHQDDINLEFGLHLHTSFEFIWVQSGHIECMINHRSWNVLEGQAMLILPNQLHAYHTPDHAKTYLCVFSADHIYRFWQAAKNKSFTTPVFPFDDGVIIDHLKRPDNIYARKASLYKIIAHAMRYLQLDDVTDTKKPLMQQIVMYVQNHFKEPIGLREMAGHLGYNYHYLSAYINRRFNITFPDLLNQYRLDYATNRLEESSDSIGAIALESGFSSLRTFNRTFKKNLHVTPSEYLKQTSMQ